MFAKLSLAASVRLIFLPHTRTFSNNSCLGCNKRINSEEFVMRAMNNVFHLKCFTCVVCGSQLQKGEQYVVKQSQLFCRNDYEKEVEMFKGYNGNVERKMGASQWGRIMHIRFCLSPIADDYFPDDVYVAKIDGRRGPKRPRTILNTQQRRAFKASFEVSPKPCRKVRENLAKETGLSLRIVQVSPRIIPFHSVCGLFNRCGYRTLGLVPKSTGQSEENPEKVQATRQS